MAPIDTLMKKNFKINMFIIKNYESWITKEKNLNNIIENRSYTILK